MRIEIVRSGKRYSIYLEGELIGCMSSFMGLWEAMIYAPAKTSVIKGLSFEEVRERVEASL